MVTIFLYKDPWMLSLYNIIRILPVMSLIRLGPSEISNSYKTKKDKNYSQYKPASDQYPKV